MNCLRADSTTVLFTETVIELLADSSLALTFFIYVYLSKIYYQEFWQTSPFGRFLFYIKRHFFNCSKHEIIIVDNEH
jgi:hypothetical protein